MSNSMRELSEYLLKMLCGAYKEVCEKAPDEEKVRGALEVIHQMALAGQDGTPDALSLELFQAIGVLSRSALEAVNQTASTSWVNCVSEDNGAKVV